MVKGPPGRGNFQSPAVSAVHELQVELCFEAAEPFRHLGFGEVHLGGGLGNATELVNGRLQKLIEFFGQVTKEDLEWRFPP